MSDELEFYVAGGGQTQYCHTEEELYDAAAALSRDRPGVRFACFRLLRVYRAPYPEKLPSKIIWSNTHE